MKIILIVIGDNKPGYVSAGCELFEKRIQHYISFNTVIVSFRGKENHTIAKEQGEKILKLIAPSDILIALDSGGKEYTSGEMAEFLQHKLNMTGKRLVFIIGGAYGLSPAILKRAGFRLSLSKLTFNHLLTRLLFLEQLYRSLTIMKGEKYHH